MSAAPANENDDAAPSSARTIGAIAAWASSGATLRGILPAEEGKVSAVAQTLRSGALEAWRHVPGVQARLVGDEFLEGGLDLATRLKFGSHLLVCPSCRKYLETYRAINLKDQDQKDVKLSDYKGKKNVLYMTTTHQTKVESKLFPIEKNCGKIC